MPGCQRCHVRLNAPVQGLEDNIQRHMMLFLCGTLRDFNLSHSKRRCQDQERSAAWQMACRPPCFVIIHLRVSSETLPDPVVKRSQ